MPTFSYAVKAGREPGVYRTWAECEAQVKGFANAKFKKFLSDSEAKAWIAGNHSPVKPVAGAPQATSTSAPTVIPTSSSTAISTVDESKGKKRTASEMVDGGDWLVVYSDGACRGNGQPGSVAGIGVWWGRDDPRNLAERCPGDQTNNRAELIAILRILEETPFSSRPLLIKSDSTYSIKCFNEWIAGWIRRNWISSSGTPVKNKELIKYIQAQLDARAQRGQQVRLEYIKAHVGIEGNEGADGLANVGVSLPVQPERSWAKLEAELRAQLQREAEKKQGSSTLEIEESPSKIRKTTAVTADKPKSASSREPFKPIPGTAAPQVDAARSPIRHSAPTPHGSQELLAYADAWLDDPAADLSF